MRREEMRGEEMGWREVGAQHKGTTGHLKRFVLQLTRQIFMQGKVRKQHDQTWLQRGE